jgi:hypothetical protein
MRHSRALEQDIRAGWNSVASSNRSVLLAESKSKKSDWMGEDAGDSKLKFSKEGNLWTVNPCEDNFIHAYAIGH